MKNLISIVLLFVLSTGSIAFGKDGKNTIEGKYKGSDGKKRKFEYSTVDYDLDDDDRDDLLQTLFKYDPFLKTANKSFDVSGEYLGEFVIVGSHNKFKYEGPPTKTSRETTTQQLRRVCYKLDIYPSGMINLRNAILKDNSFSKVNGENEFGYAFSENDFKKSGRRFERCFEELNTDKHSTEQLLELNQYSSTTMDSCKAQQKNREALMLCQKKRSPVPLFPLSVLKSDKKKNQKEKSNGPCHGWSSGLFYAGYCVF